LAGEAEDAVEDALFIEVGMPSPDLPVAVSGRHPASIPASKRMSSENSATTEFQINFE
jgi:hypothetical protein